MSMFHRYKEVIMQAAKERFGKYSENLELLAYDDYLIDETFEKGEIFISIIYNERKWAFVDCRVFFKNGQFACDFLYGDKYNLSDGTGNSLFGNCGGEDYDDIEGFLNETQRIIDRQSALYLHAEKQLLRDKNRYRCLNLHKALTEEKAVY